MSADLIITGGPVLRPDGTRQAGLAVAVTGSRISAIVPADEAADLRGRRTDVIDLRGRLLMPGFVDAHAHSLWGGLERLTCDLLEVPRTVEAYQAAVLASAQAHPDWAWLTGGGWSFEAFGGGVATSGLEMAQNSQRLSWNFEEVDQRLHRIMVDIFNSSNAAAEEYGTPGNYVNGANIAGFMKVARAMMAHGVV